MYVAPAVHLVLKQYDESPEWRF